MLSDMLRLSACSTSNVAYFAHELDSLAGLHKAVFGLGIGGS